MTLDELGIKYGTDKSSDHHDYCKIYEQYLEPIRNSQLIFVEIGVGGYQYPDRGGESLRMWDEYFPNARIHATDIFPKNFSISDRVSIHCVENSVSIIKMIIPDVIIDDGSHVNSDTIENFINCWPHLKPGGFYFVEDVHCSYWLENFRGCAVPGAEGTTMEFFTRLTHQLNDHVLQAEYKNDYAGQIEFIHFYKELIVVKKKGMAA